MGWFLFFLALCFWVFGFRPVMKVALLTITMFFGLIVLLSLFA